MIEALDLEAAETLLHGAVEQMMAAVQRFEGTVSQVQDDSILAVFGAPLAYEDHAVRACCASLALREVLHRYAEAAGHPVYALAPRVALHSGLVVTGAAAPRRPISSPAAGPDARPTLLVRGHTVQIATGLGQLAAAGQIVLTAQTLGLVEEYVEVEPLGPIVVGGRSDRVVAFELVGPGPTRTRL